MCTGHRRCGPRSIGIRVRERDEHAPVLTPCRPRGCFWVARTCRGPDGRAAPRSLRDTALCGRRDPARWRPGTAAGYRFAAALLAFLAFFLPLTDFFLWLTSGFGLKRS